MVLITKEERDYLNAVENYFKHKSAEAREKLRTLRFSGPYSCIDLYADSMDICATLVATIRSDFEKLEKMEETNEQKTS